MSGSKRTPITRTTLAGISPQAVAIYREMRKLKCSCGNPAGGRGPPASEPLAQLGVFRKMRTEFYFTPELHLKDGRIIRDLYRIPEIVTRGRFPDGGESDSTW